MTKTKPITDEWKDSLLRYCDVFDTKDGSYLNEHNVINFIEELLHQATSKAREEERSVVYKNINSWFEIPIRKGMKPIMVPPGLDKNKPEGGLVKLKGCEVCGGRLVYIRGQYPGGKKRKVCPTCAVEILESIKSNLNTDAGTDIQSLKKDK